MRQLGCQAIDAETPAGNVGILPTADRRPPTVRRVQTACPGFRDRIMKTSGSCSFFELTTVFEGSHALAADGQDRTHAGSAALP